MIAKDVSLVLTVLDEAESIEPFLSSIAAGSMLPAELVVVDGGSRDGTVEILRGWDAPEGCAVRVIVEPGAGISHGRNRAIAAASHECILVTDAGTHLDPRWVELLVARLESEERPDVVSGFFYPTGDSWVQRAIAFTVTPSLQEIDPADFLPSSRSIAFRKSAWEAVGGYPEWLDYCEDLVFDLSLKEQGCVFAFEGRALVSWSARSTIRAFMTQYYRYARGDGKAGLWPKRHAARYVAYGAGASLLAVSPWVPWSPLLLAVGVIGYMSKFWRRVISRRREFGPGSTAAALFVPIIVVAGDLAKMVGYPVGLRWARKNR